MSPPLICLTGPTATGKSGLAVDLVLALAQRGQPAEVVNADAMLVYRGMDIGTAKPSPSQRRAVPHHLIDIMDVTESASVASFQRLARQAIDQIRRRGHLPIVVGGSALYLHAIIDQVDFPPTDPAVRRRLEAELAAVGPLELYRRLTAIAPDVAARLQPDNARRVVRALEAVELQGDFRPVLPHWTYALDGVIQIGLAIDRPAMDRRIEQRVDEMWRQGLVSEVEALLARGLRQGRTAAQAIGYRQVIDYLDGRIDQSQARELTVIRTRQFARKQLTWWRRDQRIRWLSATAASPVAALAELALTSPESADAG